MPHDRFVGPGEFGDSRANDVLVLFSDAETSFNALGSQRWIDIIRAEKQGRLDIDATAENVGIDVVYTQPVDDEGKHIFTPGTVSGLDSGEQISIIIDPEWHIQEYPATFGYMLGCIYLDKVAGVRPVDNAGGIDWYRRQRIQNFCSLFGRQLMIPSKAIADVNDFDAGKLLDLMVQHRASHQDIIHQLMLHGKLPRKISFDTGTGEAKDPFYSNRVNRCIICLDCEIQKPHVIGRHPETTPNFDFTMHQWSGYTSMTECTEYDRTTRLDEFVSVNRQYGTWTDEDDVLIPEARIREREMQLEFLKYMQGQDSSEHFDTDIEDD